MTQVAEANIPFPLYLDLVKNTVDTGGIGRGPI
jgi:hypothetical protein